MFKPPPIPSLFNIAEPIALRGSPIFIIWNGRKELTRLYGYGTRENFYERIEQKFKPGYLNEQN